MFAKLIEKINVLLGKGSNVNEIYLPTKTMKATVKYNKKHFPFTYSNLLKLLSVLMIEDFTKVKESIKFLLFDKETIMEEVSTNDVWITSKNSEGAAFHSFILGTTGSGKSYFFRNEIFKNQLIILNKQILDLYDEMGEKNEALMIMNFEPTWIRIVDALQKQFNED